MLSLPGLGPIKNTVTVLSAKYSSRIFCRIVSVFRLGSDVADLNVGSRHEPD